MILASELSEAGLVVRTSSVPFPFRLPARTGEPGAFDTGTDSPVIGAWLTKEVPSLTIPSTGIRSPGTVSYTHLRARETRHDLVCRLLLEKKKKTYQNTQKKKKQTQHRHTNTPQNNPP